VVSFWTGPDWTGKRAPFPSSGSRGRRHRPELVRRVAASAAWSMRTLSPRRRAGGDLAGTGAERRRRPQGRPRRDPRPASPHRRAPRPGPRPRIRVDQGSHRPDHHREHHPQAARPPAHHRQPHPRRAPPGRPDQPAVPRQAHRRPRNATRRSTRPALRTGKAILAELTISIAGVTGSGAGWRIAVCQSDEVSRWRRADRGGAGSPGEGAAGNGRRRFLSSRLRVRVALGRLPVPRSDSELGGGRGRTTMSATGHSSR
jgi:hypothetical protein